MMHSHLHSDAVDWNRERQCTYRHLVRRGGQHIGDAWADGMPAHLMAPCWRDELAVCARLALIEILKTNQR